MALGGLYSTIYITIHSPINYLCALDTTLKSTEHMVQITCSTVSCTLLCSRSETLASL